MEVEREEGREGRKGGEEGKGEREHTWVATAQCRAFGFLNPVDPFIFGSDKVAACKHVHPYLDMYSTSIIALVYRVTPSGDTGGQPYTYMYMYMCLFVVYCRNTLLCSPHIHVPSEMELIFSKALAPVLKGENASRLTMEPKRPKSVTASWTSGRRAPMSSVSLQRKTA